MELLRVSVMIVLVFMLTCLDTSEGRPAWKRPKKHGNGRHRWRFEESTKERGLGYLKKYYRVRGPRKTWSHEPSMADLRETLLDLQSVAHLKRTGVIDEPTARAMKWPRCGNYDVLDVNMTSEGERRRRYALSGPQYRWNVNDLTYMIENYPDEGISIITQEEVDEAVAAAFKVWSDVTPLTFTRVPPVTEADIVLSFGKRTHTSVEDDPTFDGPGGSLAHAFPPNSGWGSLNGDLHYDDEETFTHKKHFGRNIFYITAHELGHSLGLDHSNVEGALMWPFIRGYTPNFRLPEDDIRGIQEIYGPNPNPPARRPDSTTIPPSTTPMPVPAYCNLAFDEVAIIRGEIFAFHGKKLWRFSTDGYLITPEEGSTIRSYFGSVPSVVHAIFERWYDERVIFVKGRKAWTLGGSRFEETSSQDLSGLGLPKLLDAAMHRASEGITYYFKDKVVYKYDEFDEVLTEDSPLKTHMVFPGIPRPTRVTSAFTGTDGNHYLLVGTEYYRVDPDLTSTGTPSNFAQDFLRCPRV